jgi:hypothetical protein
LFDLLDYSKNKVIDKDDFRRGFEWSRLVDCLVIKRSKLVTREFL